jgi:hypothetical protein
MDIDVEQQLALCNEMLDLGTKEMLDLAILAPRGWPPNPLTLVVVVSLGLLPSKPGTPSSGGQRPVGGARRRRPRPGVCEHVMPLPRQ